MQCSQEVERTMRFPLWVDNNQCTNSANRSTAFVTVCMETDLRKSVLVFMCVQAHTRNVIYTYQGMNMPDNFCTCMKCHRDVILQFEQNTERENEGQTCSDSKSYCPLETVQKEHLHPPSIDLVGSMTSTNCHHLIPSSFELYL